MTFLVSLVNDILKANITFGDKIGFSDVNSCMETKMVLLLQPIKVTRSQRGVIIRFVMTYT